MAEGSIDQMLSVVQTRELLAQLLSGRPLDVRASVRVAPVILDVAHALDALEMLRDADVPMVLVSDEYGVFQGVVTPADLLETIAGTFRADADTNEPGALQREDGSWLLAGWLPADEMAGHLGLRLSSERDFHSTAGYILNAFERLPGVGEHVLADGWHFKVVDLDGNRIDKVIATRC